MKNKFWTVLSYVFVALAGASVALVCCLLIPGHSDGKLEELEGLIDKYFIGEVDQAAVDDAVADAMVSALGDRWSYYMTAEEYLSYQDTMANSYVGVGITVQAREDGQGLDIIAVTAGSPAEEAGIQRGDILTAVGDTTVAGLSASEVGKLIKGPEGTTVSVTVDRAGERLDFTLERRRIETPVATLELLDGIALITIENFDSRCAQETIAAIESAQAQGAKALIFDVRNNPGGYKDELVQVLDYLLPEGVLFRAEDYSGKTSVDRSDAACVELPMAVLVNGNSYSAAEFFAAALEEYGAAVVVGEQTSGKGYFQSSFELSDGSAVVLSIGKYYTPQGNSLADVGLTPEVSVPVEEETAALIYYGLLEPARDPQIQAAINAIKCM